MRRYDDALTALKRLVNRNPDWLPAHSFLSATYAELGRPDQAMAEVLETQRISPGLSTE